MNKIEELKKLKEQAKKLNEKIETMEKELNIDFDPIFLLSAEEYEKYKNKIPVIDTSWWLRSPDDDVRKASAHTQSVKWDADICTYGFPVQSMNNVRPALKINPNEWFLKGDESRIVHCGVTWIQIDEGLYIAELPIALKQFDTNNNDYSTSEIRQFLLDWYAERQNWQ